MKTLKSGIFFLLAGMMAVSLCFSQTNQDSILAKKAYDYLRKANRANGVTIGFGIASNIEMAALGGFPLEVDDGLNAGANLTHMCFALGRVITVPFPIARVNKARKILEPWRVSPEMAPSCEKLFANLDAARVMSAVAPVLTVAGGVMMFVSSVNHTYYEEYDPASGSWEGHSVVKNPGLKTAGWIFVGAGLACSISSSILVSASKKELASKMGYFRVNAGAGTIGLQYNLPSMVK